MAGLVALLELLLIHTYLWMGFLAQHKRDPASPVLIINGTVAVVIGIAVTTFIVRRPIGLHHVFVRLLLLTSLLGQSAGHPPGSSRAG